MKNKKEPLPIIKGAKDLKKINEVKTICSYIVGITFIILLAISFITEIIKRDLIDIRGIFIILIIVVIYIIKNKLN